jgi:hypothetical protein
MQLKAGGLSFHFLESGSGEVALLFLHYWGGSARTWNAVISHLSPDFRCIAYDQRGWANRRTERRCVDFPLYRVIAGGTDEDFTGILVVLLRTEKVVMFASTTLRICLGTASLICALSLEALLSAQEPRTPAPSATSGALEYRIGPRDVVQIDVSKEPEITRTIPVRPDGKISLPLLNDVQTAGLTALQLADVIRKGLMTYLTNPQVTVTVRGFGTKPFIVPPSKSAPRSLPSPDIKPKCCVA